MRAEEKGSYNRRTGSEGPLERVSKFDIFRTFFRIGLLTIGGGFAMASVIRHELVLRRRWVSEEEFLAGMSTATVVPGAVAVNLAYIQGKRLAGHTGSIAAVAGTVLPSFFIILLIALGAMPFFENRYVAAFFRGCAVGICGQLAYMGYVLARRDLRDPRSIALCAAALLPVALLGLHPVWAIITAAMAGYWLLRDEKAAG